MSKYENEFYVSTHEHLEVTLTADLVKPSILGGIVHCLELKLL